MLFRSNRIEFDRQKNAGNLASEQLGKLSKFIYDTAIRLESLAAVEAAAKFGLESVRRINQSRAGPDDAKNLVYYLREKRKESKRGASSSIYISPSPVPVEYQSYMLKLYLDGLYLKIEHKMAGERYKLSGTINPICQNMLEDSFNYMASIINLYFINAPPNLGYEPQAAAHSLLEEFTVVVTTDWDFTFHKVVLSTEEALVLTNTSPYLFLHVYLNYRDKGTRSFIEEIFSGSLDKKKRKYGALILLDTASKKYIALGIFLMKNTLVSDVQEIELYCFSGMAPNLDVPELYRYDFESTFNRRLHISRRELKGYRFSAKDFEIRSEKGKISVSRTLTLIKNRKLPPEASSSITVSAGSSLNELLRKYKLSQEDLVLYSHYGKIDIARIKTVLCGPVSPKRKLALSIWYMKYVGNILPLNGGEEIGRAHV